MNGQYSDCAIILLCGFWEDQSLEMGDGVDLLKAFQDHDLRVVCGQKEAGRLPCLMLNQLCLSYRKLKKGASSLCKPGSGWMCIEDRSGSQCP